MKKRIIGLDTLRDIGVIFIFLYHFCVEYVLKTNGTDATMCALNYFFNILARPASLFLFIISGYALMYNKEDELSLGKYFKRRFKGLFIPFYVAYTLMFLVSFLVNNQTVGKGLPLKRMIFTIIGIDGVAEMMEPNFYLIGEWFMSCIVVCYLLFPILAKLLKRFKYATLVVLLVWYFFALYIYNPFPFSQLMHPLFVIVYFYLGMFWQSEFGGKRIPNRIRVLCAVAAVLIFLCFWAVGYVPVMMRFRLGLVESEVFYFALSLMMLFALKDADISPETKLYEMITYISGISWYVILVHHRIIILLDSRLYVAEYSHREVLALFLVCVFLTWAMAILVRELSNRVKVLIK